MTLGYIKWLGLVALTVTLSACSLFRSESETSLAPQFPPHGTACNNDYEAGIETNAVTGPGISAPLWQFVKASKDEDAQPSLDVLRNTDKLKDILEEFGGGRSDNLLQKILRARKGFANTGMGSFSLLSFLDAADFLDGGNDGHQLSIEGQILAYFYNKNQKTDKNNRIKMSCMWVRMTVEVMRAGGSQSRSFQYEMHVFGVFKVAPRDPTDPKNVFPTSNTVETAGTKVVIDPITNDEITIVYNYKLWARGSNEVKVTRARVRLPFLFLNNWWTVPFWWPIYQGDEDSCIDMMFEPEPPETLPAGTEPPVYCLGRCEYPQIVNTGA